MELERWYHQLSLHQWAPEQRHRDFTAPVRNLDCGLELWCGQPLYPRYSDAGIARLR